MGFLDKYRAAWHEPGRYSSPDAVGLAQVPPKAEPALSTPMTTAQVVQADTSFRLEPTQPRYRLADLVLDPATHEAILEAANTVKAAPVLECWLGEHDRAGRRVAVNFFGPPGVGKSSAVEALAHLLGVCILRVNYAELESRFVGETPKNLRQAFRQAAATGGVLFFDEADSALGKRFSTMTQANEAYINQARSTLMLEMDAFQGVVAFATNLAGNYDEAFVRRIASHVRFRLPDHTLRIRVWEKYLPATLPRDPEATPGVLAGLTEGFSPADIATAVRRAAVQAAIRAGHERKVLLEDLRKAIERIREAKEEVGARNLGSKTTYETLPDMQPEEGSK